MSEIRWAPLAKGDLERIARHYRAIDPTLAIEVAERIVGATDILAELPKAGQATLGSERRRWRVSRTEYVLFYRITHDHVRILRVLHGAQQLAGQL